MQVLDAGHTYELEGGQQVWFIKRKDGELIQHGTTNEEVLGMLIDRTKFLNDKFPCVENEIALKSMETALWAFNSRTQKRVAQGVETKDIAHVS